VECVGVKGEEEEGKGPREVELARGRRVRLGGRSVVEREAGGVRGNPE
jgi:hypothetical protein